MAKRVKAAPVEVRVPQSHDEAVEFIGRIGQFQRERDRIQADMNDRIEAIRGPSEKEAAQRSESIKALAEGIQTWAAANRARLTEDGKVKSRKLATGVIGWRTNPPSVSLRGVAEVLKSLKAKGLARFIRTKEEIDKEAMLKEQEIARKIKGVTIQQKENFFVVPNETELEEIV